MNTEKVNMAVKKGDENAENTVATATTIPTSSKVRLAEAASTRRSSGAASAYANPSTPTKIANGIGKYTRQRGSFHAAAPAKSSPRTRLPSVRVIERSAMLARASKS